MSEREEKCAEQRKEGVQPRRLGLKWLKEGEWRREEGIVEFIAILRWLHKTCIFRQSESNWLHFGRTYQCRLGFTKCALPKREKMPNHFLSIF